MKMTTAKGEAQQFRSEAELAVKALYKYCQQLTTKETEKKDLFIENQFEYIWLIVALKKQTAPRALPLKIPIPHSFRTEGCMNNDVCLITGEPADQISNLLKEKSVQGIAKVVDISQLKSIYRQFEARRLLCASYDLFLADSRCISSLPSILGKKFAIKKKLPIEVDLQVPNLQQEIEKALNCTSLIIPSASNITIRASVTQLEESKSLENVLAVLTETIRVIPGNFENIQSVNLKIATSPAFPIYCCVE